MTVGGGENKGTTFCILVNAWLLVGSHHCSTDVMLSVTAGLSQSIVVDLIKLLQLVRGLFFFFLKLLPHHSPCKTYVQLRLREYLMNVIKFSRWKFIEISWKGVHLLKAGNKHSSGSWLDCVCTWGHTRPVLHGKRRAREQQIPMLKKKREFLKKKYFGSSVFQLLMHVISWAFVLFFSASLCRLALSSRLSTGGCDVITQLPGEREGAKAWAGSRGDWLLPDQLTLENKWQLCCSLASCCPPQPPS